MYIDVIDGSYAIVNCKIDVKKICHFENVRYGSILMPSQRCKVNV